MGKFENLASRSIDSPSTVNRNHEGGISQRSTQYIPDTQTTAPNAPMQLHSALLYADAQPRLEIGAVDDPLEREADTVAERVLQMPEPFLPARERGSGGEGNLIRAKASSAPITTQISPQLESGSVPSDCLYPPVHPGWIAKRPEAEIWTSS